jgi:phosphoribosylanthranilate isomerase
VLVVKVCGVTTVGDAEACARLGVDMVGVNLVPSSPRRVDLATARAISGSVRGRLRVVGVVADQDEVTLRRWMAEAGLDLLQLHGDEAPEFVDALGAVAFKALRVGSAEDAEGAARFRCDPLLVDAKVPGLLGGTGHAVDPALVAGLAKTRRLILAGGLGPENVAAAVRAVAPWGVDVASGVESSRGVKDLARVEAFVRAARGAAAIGGTVGG